MFAMELQEWYSFCTSFVAKGYAICFCARIHIFGRTLNIAQKYWVAGGCRYFNPSAGPNRINRLTHQASETFGTRCPRTSGDLEVDVMSIPTDEPGGERHLAILRRRYAPLKDDGSAAELDDVHVGALFEHSGNPAIGKGGKSSRWLVALVAHHGSKILPIGAERDVLHSCMGGWIAVCARATQ